MPPHRLSAVVAALLLWAAAPAAAQLTQRVDYEIAFPNAARHEADVVATFRGAPAGAPLSVRMSRSSPGRYAAHDFAKNVFAVRVTDGAGRPLAVTRPDPHQWDVHGHDGTVVFRYSLFADRADGTYSGIDASHAHLNMPATFAWARGMDAAPVRVAFRVPEGWEVATQLAPTADPAAFTAPNLQYFMDSPVEVGPVRWRTWEIANPHGGAPYRIRLAMHHQGTEAQLDSFADLTRRVVDEQVAMWGGPPRFDYGTYTFLACYNPWVAGDGMEHRNSTVLTSTRPISGAGAVGNLGTVSHEFFHAWNVERLRPATLEPFDFTDANLSDELWFAEGFTSYYDDLFLRRAGVLTDSAYADGLSGMLSTVLYGPGRRFFSAVEMSRQAPFVDAAASIDPTNRGNTFLSYYTWGAAIGLGLDLELRGRFPGRTLDGYMRLAWERFGRPERPYTVADLRALLGEYTGDRAFADGFFARYVEGREVPDYETLLAQAGFALRAVAPSAWLGAPVDAVGGVPTVTGYPGFGGTMYDAGATRGDRILAFAGTVSPSLDDLRAALDTLTPGDTIEIELEGRGVRRRARVPVATVPAWDVVPYESAGRTVTPEMEAFRRAWLSSRVNRER